MLGFVAASHTKNLNPFGLRILQIVDFGTTSGAERSSEPQIGIFDFQLFGLQVFAPIDFSAENQKSLKRFGKRPAPARSGPKIKAVLPPSHLIGRARIHNEKTLHWLLLLGSKADSTTNSSSFYWKCLLILPLRLFTKIVEKTEVFSMKQETKFETYDGVEVAESPLLRAERSNPYGSVPGLDDEELLGPAEIERLIMKQEFGRCGHGREARCDLPGPRHAVR